MSEIRVNRISNIDGSSTVEFATGVSGNAEGLRFEPKVVAFDPTNLATGVDRNLTHINVTFDQPVEFSGVGTVRVRAGFATGTVYEEYTCGVSTNLLISGETLRINLTSGTLDGTTQYFVTLPSVGIANTYTQYYKGTENYVFTTADATFNVDGGDYQQIIYNGSSPTNYYKYNIFTSSGIATFSAPSASAEDFSYMLIAGGGGGGGDATTATGYGGGGGAGGLLKNYNSAGFVAGELTVTIGSAGNGAIFKSPTASSYPVNHPQRPIWWDFGNPGSDSSVGPTPVGTITAYGGGAAGDGYHTYEPFTPTNIPDHHGKPGGSGGGGSKARPYPQGTTPSDNIPGQPYRPGGDALGYPGPAQQGYPGGFTYNYPYPYNDQSRGSGGGGGAGQAGQPEVRYNPHHSPNRYNLPSTSCQGGDGAPNPEFTSSVLSYINGVPSTLYSAAGPQGYFAGGGGGSVRAYSTKYPTNPTAPNYFTPQTTGQGGEGGGGRGSWYSQPPNPFASGNTYIYSEKGIDGMGGGGGGGDMGPSSPYPNPQYPSGGVPPAIAPGPLPQWAPQRPQWVIGGAPGGSGGFYIRYAHPGSV